MKYLAVMLALALCSVTSARAETPTQIATDAFVRAIFGDQDNLALAPCNRPCTGDVTNTGNDVEPALALTDSLNRSIEEIERTATFAASQDATTFVNSSADTLIASIRELAKSAVDRNDQAAVDKLMQAERLVREAVSVSGPIGATNGAMSTCTTDPLNRLFPQCPNLLFQPSFLGTPTTGPNFRTP